MINMVIFNFDGGVRMIVAMKGISWEVDLMTIRDMSMVL